MALNTPLQARFKDVSLILCGPMLRRVDPQIVSVWMALTEPRRIKLNHFELPVIKNISNFK